MRNLRIVNTAVNGAVVYFTRTKYGFSLRPILRRTTASTNFPSLNNMGELQWKNRYTSIKNYFQLNSGTLVSRFFFTKLKKIKIPIIIIPRLMCFTTFFLYFPLREIAQTF